MMNSSLMYALVMLIAGFGIPIMAALNGGLGAKLESPALAATILFSLALFIAIIYLLSTSGVPKRLYVPETPWYFYLGGFVVMFYILSITWAAPRFGISNSISFVLLGQIVAMSIIDHYGLLGSIQFSLNPRRVVGLLLMAAGVFLVLSKVPNKV